MSIMSEYIPEAWKDKIRKYKYKGTDNSIFYRYVTSPCCNYIVDHLPDDLAPNTITLMGLFCNIIIFLVTTYYAGLGGCKQLPAWACHLSSFLYFSYMFLDNMDGKQARRTGNSSPLGLMFDHGCDAVTTFLMACSVGTIVGLDSAMWFTIIWIMICFPFFLNTLEEYYTGELNFPIFHGVSEGTVIACMAMNCTGFFGIEFWNNEIMIFGITTQLNHLILTISFLSGLGFGLTSLFKILRNFREKKEEIIKNTQMFCYLVASLLLVVFYSDSQIVKNYPKVVIILFGFAFAKLVGHLQLSHLADGKFNQYRTSFLVSFFFLSVFAVKNSFKNSFSINIDNLILVFLGLHMFCWIHFAYYVTEELCLTLGIYRFNVRRRLNKF